MKKIIAILSIMTMILGLSSCNIETERSYAGDLTIEVTGLPDGVGALAFWGTPNEWKAANIEAEAEKYIVDVINGKAVFKLGTTIFSTIMWCQFQPLATRADKLNDATWWQTSFSGSSTYANAENNLVYDFSTGSNDPMTLTLDVGAVYGDVSAVYTTRFTTENFTTALKMK